MIIMQCNFYTDNTQKNADLKANIFNEIEIIKPDFSTLLSCSCHTGLEEWEPSQEEKDIYCFSDFRNCPRFLTRIDK